MLIDVFQLEGKGLGAGIQSLGIFRTAVNVVSVCDGGGIPMDAVSRQCRSALAAPLVPSGPGGQSRYRRPRTL